MREQETDRERRGEVGERVEDHTRCLRPGIQQN